jgi:hypothetical protein
MTKSGITRTTALGAAFLILIEAVSLRAVPADPVPYPAGYRTWVHVKSARVNHRSPTAGRYGGLHHIYANKEAMEGYRTGKFPDGSIIGFDLASRLNSKRHEFGSSSKRHRDPQRL